MTIKHTATYCDGPLVGLPITICLDLSRVATDEQVITREDWAAIPDLWSSATTVDRQRWGEMGPRHGAEFVLRGDMWSEVDAMTNKIWIRPLDAVRTCVCNEAVSFLVARDTRLPEVGR